MLVLVVVGAGVAAAGVIGWAARRWPSIEAPRVSGETIVAEVAGHPSLRAHLRRHYDPRTETGVALAVATAVVVGAAVGVGVLLAVIRTRLGVQSVDGRLARFAADHATEWSTSFFRHLSELGGTRGVLVLSCVATAFELWRRPSGSLVAFMTLVVGGQFALSNGIKVLVERARPDISRLTGYAGTSFPSGHATAAAATLAAIALITSRRRSRRAKVLAAALAAGLAVAVAGTRVMLGVHWFTDVSAGLLLGWGWFAACSIAFGGRLLTFGLAVDAAEHVADRISPD